MSAARVGWAVAVAEAALIAWLLLAGRTTDPLGDGGSERPATASTVPVPATVDAPPAAHPAPAPTPAPAPAAPTPAVTPAPAAPDPGLGIVVYGRVTDAQGNPVEASVGLRDTAGRYLGSRGPAYAIAGLSPGPWTLYWQAQGYRTGQEPIVLEAANPVLRRDVVIVPSVFLKVRFRTPEGGSLVEAIGEALKDDGGFAFESPIAAVATADRPPARLPLTEARSVSRYGVGTWRSRWDHSGAEIPAGFDGILELDRTPPVFVSIANRDALLLTEPVPAGAEEVTLVLGCEAFLASMGTIRARLVEPATGAALADGGLHANHRQGGNGWGAAVGADGTARIVRVPPGLLLVTASGGEGREVFRQYVRVDPGKESDLGVLPLHPSTPIAGRVVDEHGKPLPSATLRAYPLDRISRPQEMDQYLAYGAGDDGAFEIYDTGRGRYVLLAETKGSAVTALAVDTSGGPVRDLTVVVRSSGTRLTIDPKVDGSRHYLAVLHDAAGVPVWTFRIRGPWPRSVTVAPGTYTLVVHDDDGAVFRKTSVEVADAPVTVPLGG